MLDECRNLQSAIYNLQSPMLPQVAKLLADFENGLSGLRRAARALFAHRKAQHAIIRRGQYIRLSCTAQRYSSSFVVRSFVSPGRAKRMSELQRIVTYLAV